MPLLPPDHRCPPASQEEALGDELRVGLGQAEGEGSEEEYEDMTLGDAAGDRARSYDRDTDMDEAAEAEMLERIRRAREDAVFPDEVDTPLHMYARKQFIPLAPPPQTQPSTRPPPTLSLTLAFCPLPRPVQAGENPFPEVPRPAVFSAFVLGRQGGTA